SSSTDVRLKMKLKYENEFRDPAVAYLKKAEGSADSPAYLEGLIALYEKRFDDALKKSREASSQTPWSYDAKTLGGKALAGMAQKLFEKEDYKGSIQQNELAGVAFARASELGRSRPDIYLSDCERWGNILDAQAYTGAVPTASLQKAEEA